MFYILHPNTDMIGVERKQLNTKTEIQRMGKSRKIV